MSGKQLARGLKQKGNIAFKEKKYQQAEKYYTQSIQAYPLLQAYSNRCATLIHQLRYEQALEDCNQALKMDSNHVKSIQRKGKCMILMLQIDEGIQFLTDSIKPGNKASITQIIDFGNKIKDSINNYREARKKNDFTKAKQCLNVFFPQMKNDTRVIISYIQCQAKTTTRAQATNMLKTIQDCIDQTCFIYWYLRAIIQLSGGQKSLVKRYMLESIRYFTTKPLKEAEKGLLIEFTKQQMIQMIQKVEKSIELHRDALETAKGVKKKQGIKKITKLLEMDAISNNQRYDLLMQRANCYKSLRLKPKQLNDLNTLIRMQPNLIKALQARMDFYEDEKKYELAYIEAKRLHKLTSNHQHDILRFNNQRKSKELSKINYYDLLEVKPNATAAQIKRAFKQLALIYHPDKNIDLNSEEQQFAKNKFKDIMKAHLCLLDPDKRKFYDLHKCERQQYEEAELAKANQMYQMHRGKGRRETSGFNPNFEEFFKTGFNFQFSKNFGDEFSFNL